MDASALVSALVVALLPLVIHLVGSASTSRYHRLALHPRNPQSIWAIASYPLVHVNFRHLAFNCVPLLLLGLLIATKSVSTYWLATVLILLVGGWGTWLFSSADRVAGASGLVFGYWGFIIASAALSEDPFWTAAAALTLMVYAGLWSSLMKLEGGISWAGHFWGLVGGITSAVLVS
jgi:membrane associated rhomboid family serine protease